MLICKCCPQPADRPVLLPQGLPADCHMTPSYCPPPQHAPSITSYVTWELFHHCYSRHQTVKCSGSRFSMCCSLCELTHKQNTETSTASGTFSVIPVRTCVTQTASSWHLLFHYLLSPKSQEAPRWCPARINRNYSIGEGRGRGGQRLLWCLILTALQFTVSTVWLYCSITLDLMD